MHLPGLLQRGVVHKDKDSGGFRYKKGQGKNLFDS
jgi:hypothetical protein